jgi:hypothetical protein
MRLGRVKREIGLLYSLKYQAKDVFLEYCHYKFLNLGFAKPRFKIPWSHPKSRGRWAFISARSTYDAEAVFSILVEIAKATETLEHCSYGG